MNDLASGAKGLDGGSERTPSLQRLAQLYGPELLAYANRHIPAGLRRILDPQDIVQDAYFEAFRRVSEFSSQDVELARRWLKTITRNRLIDLVRRHRTLKHGNGQFVEEVHHGSVIVLLQELAVYERTPSRSAVAHELLQMLSNHLNRLDPGQRLALRLRYIEGLSFKDVAQKMGYTEGAARLIVFRGLGALRTEFASISDSF